MKHCIIDPKNGEVVNVVIWEGAEWLPPRGYAVIRSDAANIGDKYDFEKNEFIFADRQAKDELLPNDL